MKMRFLIHIEVGRKNYILRTCWPKNEWGENIRIIADSRGEAISMIHGQIALFIEKVLKSSSEFLPLKTLIDCPQAYVELPIDRWHCKDNKQLCPLQGQIDMSNQDSFLKRCLVSEERKNGILNAIIKGKYTGFHHVPGRYRCVLCEKPRRNFNYHFPWELTLLDDHCDTVSIRNDANRVRELILGDFRISALASAMCGECFLKTSDFFPEVNSSEYEILTYNYERNI